jgi:RNA polymerase sigma-70 factor (ECF subfamily)
MPVTSDDVGAFMALWRKYARLVWRAAFQITRNHHDTEDIVQDVFHTIWKERPDNDARSDLEPWIRRLATNRAIDFLRHREVRERAFVVLAGGEDGLLDPDGDGRVRACEVRRAVEKAMTNLSDAEKLSAYLKYVEQMSAAEIGERLGIDPGAARMAVYRASGKLRSALKRLVE